MLATINTNNNQTDEPLNKIARLDENDKLDEEEADKDKENQQITTNLINKEKKATTRRKKKLIIDDIKEIDSVTMKSQFSDTSAIVASLELAPPTRKLMQLKESGSIDKLFLNTSRSLTCLILQKLYTRNMIIKKQTDQNQQSKDATSGKLQNNILDENSTMLSIAEKQRENVNENEKLPLMDSLLDNNELSKHSNLMQMNNDVTIENNLAGGDTSAIGGDAANKSGGGADDTLLFNPLDNHNFDNNLEQTNAQLEITPPHHKQKNANTTSRKSGVSNVTTFNSELIIDDDDANADSNKILNKRAKTMISILNKSFSKHANIGFFELTKRNGRKQVAQKFYSLLILKKYDAIDVTQVDSFDDIIITKSHKFDNFVSC